MRNSLRVLSILVVLFFLAGITTTTFAAIHTSAVPKARVTEKVDNSKRATLYGHVSAAVRMAQDMGRQDPDTPSPGMIMVLKSDEGQKQELRRIIDEQQDRRTSNYHQWVTPEEFGEHFGVHDADIEQVKDWLASQGFTVDEVSKSKRVIKFSGNIGQVEKAFQTEMHLYNYKGEMHVANNSEISVPNALKKVIEGVTLHNFYRKPHFDLKNRIKDGKRFKVGPDFTSSSSVHYVAPADFATIYNTAPLIAAGINGTGTSIAIVGRSDILLSDVTTFRQMMNLPVNDPVFIHAGQDNGQEPGDDGESDLDVEQSGATAPESKINFVIGTPAFLVDGITNSIQYIVENNVADIMSISYGDCEYNEGVGGNAFNLQAFEQAAAQGISVFIASGDNGPAGCDDQNDTYEVLGYAAAGEGSTPYGIAVGGTEMVGECATVAPGCTQSNYAKYWSTTTNSFYLNSALAYIPEYAWNDAKASTFAAVPTSAIEELWSSSGGISAYYTRPSWQVGPPGATSIISSANANTDPSISQGGNWIQVNITNPGSGYTAGPTVAFTGETCTSNPTTTLASTIVGGSVTAINYNYGAEGGTLHVGQGINCTVAGTVAFTAAPTGGTTATGTATLVPMQMLPAVVPGVGHRLTPDVALSASSDQDGLIICSEGICTDGYLGVEGGTSVAAPSMAGIQALVNNYMAQNYPEPGNPTGRQGMPGYVYYQLAAAQYTNNGNSYAACNSNNLTGGTYTTPPSTCAFQDIETGNNFVCGTSTCTSTSGARIGFSAAPGYDLTTGLGSVNGYNLATQWNSVTGSFAGTATYLNAPTVTGSTITLSGYITYTSATAPTGDVGFIFNQGGVGDPVNPTTGAFVNPGTFATIGSVTAPNNSCTPPGGAVCFSATINNLSGTYNPATLNVTARYGGDNINASSYSAAQALSPNTEAATVTITPGYITGSTCLLNYTSSFAYGANVWTTINVAGASGVPTGTVTLTNTNPAWNGGNGTGVAYSLGTFPVDPQGNVYLVTGSVPSSSCVYDYTFAQAPALPGGTNTISATYSGDTTFTAPGSPTTATVTVTPLTTTPTLAAGATVINAGFADTLTATFAANSAVTSNTFVPPPGISGPTGTVQFYDGAVLLGTATAIPQVIFTSNDSSSSSLPSWTYTATAVLTTTGITTTGANSITAKYLGDTNYVATTSTAVTVTVGTEIATTTTVTASPNPTTLRGEPTFTATVAATPTSPTAGTVTFYDATYGVVLGTGTVGTAHTATLKLGATPAFVGGNHSINAMYGGSTTGTFGASVTFTPAVETVTKGTMTIDLAGKQLGKTGQTYAFQATLNCATPTGSGGCSAVDLPAPYDVFPTVYMPTLSQVNFYDGATLLGSSSILPTTITYAQGGYGITIADFDATGLAAGTHTITATYADTNWALATSNSMTVYVAGTPSITWATPAPITYPTPLSSTQLDAVFPPMNGTYVYTPPSGTVLNAGLPTLSVTFTPADTTDFGPETQTVQLQVNQASQTITFTINPPASAVFGSNFTVAATGGASGNPVVFTSAGGCSNVGATYTMTSGTTACSVIANQASSTNYAAAPTVTKTTTATMVATSIAVGVTPASEDYGSSVPVTITATLSWAGSGAAPTAGDVTIGGSGLSGSFGTTSCGAPSGDTMTCTNTYTGGADLPGSYTMTAAFSGDTNYTASSSTATNNFTINGATTTTSVVGSPNPSTYATPVTFTATITAENGMFKGKAKPRLSGNVTWSANTGCAPSSVSGYPGVVTCTTSRASSLQVGADTVTATYAGDSNHGGSVGTWIQTVTGGIATTIDVISVSPASEDYGLDAPVTITALLTWTGNGVAPTAANVTIGGNGLGTYGTTSCAARVHETMTCTNTFTPSALDVANVYTETAAFAGDANYSASSSPETNNFTINGATSTTVVTSSVNPSVYAQSVTFTATITGPTGSVRGKATPREITGTVTWSANTGCAPSTVSGYPGVVTCTTSSATHLPVGADTITAIYGGDSNHGGSTGTLIQTVTGGIATTIDVTGVSPAAEDFGLNAPVTITALLTWTGNGVAPTASDVTISGNGFGTYGTTSCAARVHKTITCTNTYTPTVLDVQGVYTETAAFAGDATYSASSSPETNNFTINQATAATVVTSNLNPSIYGQSVTFTATITGENGSVKGKVKRNVTGSVTWSDNTGCASTVVSGNPGVSTCTTSSLAAGTDAITATYSGDLSHGGSTGTLSQVVTPAATTVVWPNPAAITYGTALSGTQLDATVTPVGATGSFVYTPPAGTVLNAGSQPLSVTFTPSSGNYTGSTGTATLVVNPASQTITCSVPAPGTAVDKFSFTLTCAASTPVTYSSSGACTNVGATYTMDKTTGTCTETLTAPASTNYLAATPVVMQTTVAAAVAATVHFTGAPTDAYYNSTFNVTATTNATTLPTVTATPATVCTVAPTSDPTIFTVSMISGTGTCSMTAKWAADYTYKAASATQKTIAQKIASIVTWATPAPIAYGTLLSGTQLDATASVAGAFTYTPLAGKLLTVGSHTLSVKFVPTAIKNYTTVLATTVALDVTQAPTTTTITSAAAANPLKPLVVTVNFGVAENAPGGKVTGSVTVTDSNTSLSCTGTLSAITGAGKCVIKFASAGTASLTAVYAGDANNSTSTSSAFPPVVY
jgi:hypothetical protein